LQGIKKGLVELADMIAINKADGDNIRRAESAAGDYKNALQIFTPHGATWFPPVLTVSGRDNRGLTELWAKVLEHRQKMSETGEFAKRRQVQAVSWMRDMLEDRLMSALKANPKVGAELPKIEASVRDGTLLPTLAVDQVMAMMGL
jgi:LAO/AO transport system kinase